MADDRSEEDEEEEEEEEEEGEEEEGEEEGRTWILRCRLVSISDLTIGQ